MIPFIIIFIFTILSTIYIDRLVRIKFLEERRSVWKAIHIVAYIIIFIPLLCIAYLVSDGNLIEIGILFLSILLYLGFKKYNKFKI
ncbi:hypothetical protein [Clostridium beijerinckii]|jgi:hypothetical protein|uniref:Uncharacterized protein n=1 Tax=Clostridium beijerinckii TaxID=1520 RepID=A0AAE2RUW4_CLOBE|nr:hypothetical protein [Clostridium beijerinckii]MBF7810531.1 hypothetical protein [Clostridium beijerinckii]NOW91240.1 hypothetical protein [Clostridium beijerinckii]NRT23803.1 hypothetical protein [Clostridium beijerinckii]NRT68615.1 hypothetical protein [Clostridium beijerinckii]NRT86203.1 hypothetical protein [Clostridium beijerinckii]